MRSRMCDGAVGESRCCDTIVRDFLFPIILNGINALSDVWDDSAVLFYQRMVVKSVRSKAERKHQSWCSRPANMILAACLAGVGW